MADKTLSYYKTKEVLAKEKGGTSLTIQDNPPVIGENWKRAPCECQERMESHHSYDNDLQIINEMIEFRTRGARCPSHNTAQYAANVDKSQYGDMDKAMKLIPCSCNMKKYLDCDCDVKANLCECQYRTACPEDWDRLDVYGKTGDFNNRVCQCYTRFSICEFYTSNSIDAPLRKRMIVNEGIENHLDPNPQLCDCDSRTMYDCVCKLRHTEDCECNATKFDELSVIEQQCETYGYIGYSEGYTCSSYQKKDDDRCTCRSRQQLSCIIDSKTTVSGSSVSYQSKTTYWHDKRYWYYADNKIDCACKVRLFDSNFGSSLQRNSSSCECHDRTVTIYDDAGNACICVNRDTQGCRCQNTEDFQYGLGCECYARDFSKIPGYDCLCKQRGMPDDVDCLRDGVVRDLCVRYTDQGAGTNLKQYYSNYGGISYTGIYHSPNSTTLKRLCHCVMRGFTSCVCDLRYSSYIHCKCNLRRGETETECECRYRSYSTGCDIYNMDVLYNDYTFYSNSSFSQTTGESNGNNYQIAVYKEGECTTNTDNHTDCITDYNGLESGTQHRIVYRHQQYYTYSYQWGYDIIPSPVNYYPYRNGKTEYNYYYISSECDCKNRDANDCLCKKRITVCTCQQDYPSPMCDCDERTNLEQTQPKCYCKYRTAGNSYCNCDNQAVSCNCDLRTQDKQQCESYTANMSVNLCSCYSKTGGNEYINNCNPYKYDRCICVLRMTPNIHECSCKYRTGVCSCDSRESCMCVQKIVICDCNLRTNEFFKCFSDADQNRSVFISHQGASCVCQSKQLIESDTEHLCICQKNLFKHNCNTKFAALTVNGYNKVNLVSLRSRSPYDRMFSGNHDFHKHIADYSDFENEE